MNSVRKGSTDGNKWSSIIRKQGDNPMKATLKENIRRLIVNNLDRDIWGVHVLLSMR